MFYFNYEDFKVLGSSPDLLFSVKMIKLTIRPIAGTRPRGKTKNPSIRLNKIRIA